MKKLLLATLSLLAMLMTSADAYAWKWTSVSPAEGEVESLGPITLANPDGSWLDWREYPSLTIVGDNGIQKEYNSTDNMSGGTSLTAIDYQTITTAGTYTLTIPANSFFINGVGNDATTYTWTVKGEAPASAYTISYNAGDLKVTWPANTVVAPVGDELHPQLIGYNDDIQAGVWFADNEIISYVTLAPGEYTLKFPAGDFTVNGTPNEEFAETFTVTDGGDNSGDDPAEEKGVITIISPIAGMTIDKIPHNSILAEFTTTKAYSQVTVELRNKNDLYHNLYDLPMRYMDSVEPGTHICRASTPGETNPTWYPFKGDEYELIVRGYVNYWDDDPDAIASVTIKGNGIDHEPISDVKLVSISPEDKIGKDKPVVTIKLSGHANSVTAVSPQGMDGVKKYTATPVEGTDNTEWTITIDDLDTFATSESVTSIFELDITAKDTNNATIAFSDDRADRALVLFLEIVESTPTGIVSIAPANAQQSAYNIIGQKVNANAKGIVIINGKKILNNR